jgi:hypothetical protein
LLRLLRALPVLLRQLQLPLLVPTYRLDPVEPYRRASK